MWKLLLARETVNNNSSQLLTLVEHFLYPGTSHVVLTRLSQQLHEVDAVIFHL